MAAVDLDPLLLLREAIAAKKTLVATALADASSAESPLDQASHLSFPDNSASVPIDAPTRFISNDKPVDLRSIYFAWINRDVAIPEYNASATALNAKLIGGAKVLNLGFIEKLDLITWLEGASDESEYIKPLSGDQGAAAAAAAAVATGAVTARNGAAAAVQARTGKGTLDPRLGTLHGGERIMGNRNTVLRGIKPTVSRNRLPRTWTNAASGLLPRPQDRRAFHPEEAAALGGHQQHVTRAQPA